MNTMLRKSVLGIAGLAFTGGIFAGPVAAHADARPVEGKPAAVATVQGAQSHIDLNDEQLANAKAIIAATKKAGLPERAAVISIATSLQESKLENLGHLGDANDHDSLGLFQQRPSSGWGTPEQITNPEYATLAFEKGLKQVDGWDKMPLTEAAQTVQVSAYPDAYAQWEQQATDVVHQHWNS
ncbi:hypothetical protein RMN56_17275 [Micromonospora halotolerans]|uniref:Secreted protein n=1 Tax=Micromonospora halotolerans TaxID=709879 RepID=A0ABY9ZP47_9ACTN|nr:hypothetical protein [Micromonospora halotolerans]WNM36950.1 hypothetical protein RMN56_17275 [Micromonospora halotolerans]